MLECLYWDRLELDVWGYSFSESVTVSLLHSSVHIFTFYKYTKCTFWLLHLLVTSFTFRLLRLACCAFAHKMDNTVYVCVCVCKTHWNVFMFSSRTYTYSYLHLYSTGNVQQAKRANECKKVSFFLGFIVNLTFWMNWFVCMSSTITNRMVKGYSDRVI